MKINISFPLDRTIFREFRRCVLHCFRCLLPISFDIESHGCRISPFFVTLSLFISGIVAPIFFEKYKLKTLLSYGQMCKTFLLLFLSLFLHWGAEHYTAIVYVLYH